LVTLRGKFPRPEKTSRAEDDNGAHFHVPFPFDRGAPSSGDSLILPMTTAPRVCLVGTGGYGRVHLIHLLDFHRRGELHLAAAVCLPPDPDAETSRQLREIGCETFSDFESLLRALPRLRIDLAIVPTPIHLHARMTIGLLNAGVNVLVEKPLCATLADAEAIRSVARATGRTVAVGFQYLHAPEVRELKQRLLRGEIGRVKRIVVHGAWPRSHAYYLRNSWAGRLQVGQVPVLDSPVNNAMSHFFMLMLFLAGKEENTVATPARMTAGLYRAQRIESFDTATIRLETREGCLLDFYGTHSSREISRPSLKIEGTDGRAEWEQDDHALIQGRQPGWYFPSAPEANTRERMLRAVLARLRGEPAFICTPELAAQHVKCVNALHAHFPIIPVPEDALEDHRADDSVFTFVRGLDDALRTASRQGISLAAAGLRWTPPATTVDFE
jgi:predicted dehydrogenase